MCGGRLLGALTCEGQPGSRPISGTVAVRLLASLFDPDRRLLALGVAACHLVSPPPPPPLEVCPSPCPCCVSQSGSLAAMADVWGKGEHVQCIHPLGNCIAGRQAVMDSWKAILGAGRLRISVEDVRVFAGDRQALQALLAGADMCWRVMREVRDGRPPRLCRHGSGRCVLSRPRPQ